MKATQYSFDQIAHFRLLLEQKGVSSELLQEFYDSGAIADLLEVKEPKKINRDTARKVFGLPPLTPSLLEFLGTVTIQATERFIAREKFVVDTSKKARVKISYLNDKFNAWFLPKVDDPAAEMLLRYTKLTRPALDDEIRKEIGAELEETTLVAIYELMERQKNGESGALLTNGGLNIFYVRDATGALRAVYVYWSGYGWFVLAYSVSNPGRWSDGNRVFSRNS